MLQRTRTQQQQPPRAEKKHIRNYSPETKTKQNRFTTKLKLILISTLQYTQGVKRRYDCILWGGKRNISLELRKRDNWSTALNIHGTSQDESNRSPRSIPDVRLLLWVGFGSSNTFIRPLLYVYKMNMDRQHINNNNDNKKPILKEIQFSFFNRNINYSFE